MIVRNGVSKSFRTDIHVNQLQTTSVPVDARPSPVPRQLMVPLLMMCCQVGRLSPSLFNQHLLLMRTTEVTQHRSTIQIYTFFGSNFRGTTKYGLLRG